MKNEQTIPVGRIIGFDSHPDTFTAAVLCGPTPAAAIVEKTFDKVPMAQLPGWAKKHTTAQDLFVLEASGNSFQVVRTLAALDRKALVLESCQMGKLKEAHANNDKISAVRIGKAYLAGTAKVVWVPDAKTQERRDWFHAHRKAVKRTTQMRMRLNADEFVTFANGQVSGERPRVDFEKLARFPIILPPIAEQERIVLRLSSALSKVTRAEIAARRPQERLQRYRVSVLEAAVTGELTSACCTAHQFTDTFTDSGQSGAFKLLPHTRLRMEPVAGLGLFCRFGPPFGNCTNEEVAN